ncbi:MAG: hypothetical protein AAFQ78_02510, partial [Bacteroidota bacterium]
MQLQKQAKDKNPLATAESCRRLGELPDYQGSFEEEFKRYQLWAQSRVATRGEQHPEVAPATRTWAWSAAAVYYRAALAMFARCKPISANGKAQAGRSSGAMSQATAGRKNT